MTKTNFQEYLEERMLDPEFRERFEAAERDWARALERAAAKASKREMPPAAARNRSKRRGPPPRGRRARA